MTQVRRGNATKKEGKTPDNIVVNEMSVMSADRTPKDIGDFSKALVSAESVNSPTRVQLYNLYDNIILDGMLTGIIEKRFGGVLNKALHFNTKGGKRDESFSELIESEAFEEVINGIMESKLYGITGFEFVPGNEFKFIPVPRKHIKPEKGIFTIYQSDQTGIPYENMPLAWVVGKPKDLGLLLKCAPYCIFKRGNWGDWAQYIEIFGQPIRIIYYDAYDTKTKAELKTVLDNTGSSLALMIPNQAKFEIMDGKGVNGDGRLQQSFKDSLDGELQVLILGNTETTGNANGGSNAKAKEHGKQQLEITKRDLKYVLKKLNSKKFKDILKSYGFPADSGKFEFEKEIDLEALKLRIEIDKELAALGLPIDDDYFYETYGIPKPANYNELKALQDAAKASALQPPAPAPEDPLKEEKPVKGKPPIKKEKPLKGDLNDESTEEIERDFWFKLRAGLADFFDRAR